MESKAAVTALAQESRLSVFRLLVQNGHEGLTADCTRSMVNAGKGWYEGDTRGNLAANERK